MKAYPVKFEIYDETLNDLVGRVSMFDADSAEVEIASYVFNVDSWRKFSERVESCLCQMGLEDSGE